VKFFFQNRKPLLTEKNLSEEALFKQREGGGSNLENFFLLQNRKNSGQFFVNQRDALKARFLQSFDLLPHKYLKRLAVHKEGR